MHPTEIDILNRYVASELSGALLLGRYARTTEDPYLIARLTYHCMDEARHSWLWIEFMEKRNIPIRPTHGRNIYFSYIAEAATMLDFLAAVHVYEQRVPFHLSCHAQVSLVDPELKVLIEKIRDEEQHHLAWIREYFKKLQAAGNTEVEPALKRARELEVKTYVAYIESLKALDVYSQELARLVESRLPYYPFK